MGSHSTIREGVVGGALAATGVAIWFLVVDLVAAELFFTPTRLGTALGQLLDVMAMQESPTFAFIAYTVFHYAAFAALGVLAVAAVHRGEKQPSILAASVLVFITIEALIYGFIALLHETELLEHLTWPLIAVGNALGAVVLGWWLVSRHPRLTEQLESALGGEE